MGQWLQTQRLDQDAENFIMDSAINGKQKINYRVQVPMKTMKQLGFNDIEALHNMLEEVAVTAIAPHMGGMIEEAMNKKSAVALYDALSTYYMKQFSGTNPVTLFRGKVTKGRVKMEVFWLRVGKVFVIPAYQIFNGGLNVHLYMSIIAMRGFPCDTHSTQAIYERRSWATTERGFGPSSLTTKAQDIREYAALLSGRKGRLGKPKRHLKAA